MTDSRLSARTPIADAFRSTSFRALWAGVLATGWIVSQPALASAQGEAKAMFRVTDVRYALSLFGVADPVPTIIGC